MPPLVADAQEVLCPPACGVRQERSRSRRIVADIARQFSVPLQPPRSQRFMRRKVPRRYQHVERMSRDYQDAEPVGSQETLQVWFAVPMQLQDHAFRQAGRYVTGVMNGDLVQAQRLTQHRARPGVAGARRADDGDSGPGGFAIRPSRAGKKVVLRMGFVISGATRGFSGKQQVTGQLFSNLWARRASSGLSTCREQVGLLNENVERDRGIPRDEDSIPHWLCQIRRGHERELHFDTKIAIRQIVWGTASQEYASDSTVALVTTAPTGIRPDVSGTLFSGSGY